MGEVSVLTNVSGTLSSCTTLTNGSFATVVSSERFSNGVTFKLFNSFGQSLREVSVDRNGRDATITAMRDGSFVVAWTKYPDSSLLGQRYNSNGTARGEQFTINASGSQATITATANGGFMVGWTEGELYAQRYDSQNRRVGSDFRINTTVLRDQDQSDLATLKNGNIVSVWQSEDPENQMRGQLFSPAGRKVGREFLISNAPSARNGRPSATPLRNGGFAVVWDGAPSMYDTSRVSMQLFSESGSKIGDAITVHYERYKPQILPEAVTLKNGNILVAWAEGRTSGTDDPNVFGRLYTATGRAIGARFRINSFVNGDQETPSVTALNDGGFFVAWNSEAADRRSGGIYGQRFDANGNRVSTRAGGGFAISGNGRLSGSTRADALTGGNLNGSLYGGRGNDILTGRGGRDILAGGAGADTFRYTARGDGDDRIVDFSAAQNDRLEFTNRAFGNLGRGSLAASRFQTSASSSNASRASVRFIFNQAESALYFDADGRGGQAAVKVATFSNGASVSASSIFIV